MVTMKKSVIPFLVIISLLLGAFTHKPHSLLEITEAITAYFSKRPMEKIFLHTDKPYYAVGDEIWYAAYIRDYQSSKPSTLSEILHVELFDRLGKSILQQKVQINDGFANGLLTLPDTLSANFYALKAYTNWSRNFEDGLLFNHTIKVVSPTPEPISSDTNTDVQFYPEGGRVLNGKLNHIAFCTSKPSQTRAFLINNKSDTLDTFDYDGNGFGLIRVIPESAEMRYWLNFENDTTIYPLPGATSSGTSLRLQERNDVFNLIIEGSPEYAANELSIVILNNGNIVSAFSRKLDPAGLFLVFRKDDLPYGLNHLLVYSEQDELLNDRHFYNAPPTEDLPLETKMQSTYHVRDRIYLELKSNLQSTSTVSIAVTPMKYFSDAAKPVIAQASFSEIPSSSQFSLNQLLIAEQMDAYQPEIITAKEPPSFPYEIQRKDFFQVDVTLEDVPAESGRFALTIKEGDRINLYFAEHNESDRLSVVIPSFVGNRALAIVPHDNLAKALNFTFNISIGNQPLNNLFTQNEVETAYANQVWENKITRRMFGTDYKANESLSNTRSLVFNTLESFDERVTLRDYIQLPTMKEAFKEILPYARMKEMENGELNIHLNDNSGLVKYNPFMEEEPFRMIDGVPVYDSKIIANLDPASVKSIDMLYRKTTLDDVEMHGVLHIITNDGDFGETNDVGQGSCSFQGYSPRYRFVIPPIDRKTPDFRSTLYWNPQVTIASNASSTISFPASDEPGEYKVEIQGLTTDGRPIFHESFFTILPTQ